jgi:hypothetical protein
MFPIVEAKNLNGKRFRLPEDFEGTVNLVLVAFHWWQQDHINTWIPLARQLKQQYANFSYYELPVVPDLNRFEQMRLDFWMRQGIPNMDTRHITITIYDKPESFIKPLGLDDSTIHAMLVDRSGHILWRESGIYTPAKAQSLVQGVQHV